MATDYEKEYFVSDDAFFVPFDGVDVDDTIANVGDEPSAGNLNIYLLVPSTDDSKRSQIQGVAIGSTLNKTRTSIENIVGVRGMALRAPLMISGWGYTVDSDHVLGTTEAEINAGKLDITKWKTAPLDLRYDEDRKLWVAGGGGSVKFLEFIDSEESG